MSFTIYPAIDVRDGRVVRLAQGDYALDRTSGEYRPRNFHEPLEEYFLLEPLD